MNFRLGNAKLTFIFIFFTKDIVFESVVISFVIIVVVLN